MNNGTNLSEALNRALVEEMGADPTIIILGQEIGTIGGRWGVTKNLLANFGPDRVIDAPLNEELYLGIAHGAAQFGMKPIIEFSHGTLVLLSMADLYSSALWRYCSSLPEDFRIIIRISYGPYAGPELSAFHGSIFSCIPGIKVYAPVGVPEAIRSLQMAIHTPGIHIIFENVDLYRRRYVKSSEEKNSIPVRRGTSVGLITYGSLEHVVVQTVNILEKQNITASAVYIDELNSFVKSKTFIDLIHRTDQIVVVGEEPPSAAGIFHRIFHHVLTKKPHAKVAYVGILPAPIPFGPLSKSVFPTPERIVEKVIELCNHEQQ